MINIAFRFDDPSETSDHHLEREIINLCVRYDIPINFAVIPFREKGGHKLPFTEKKASHLIEAYKAGKIEISQHGYLHKNNQPNQKVPSEFIGIPSDIQNEWIKSGQEILNGLFGTSPRGFVPPFNSFDQTTLEIIKELQFTFVSASFEVPNIKYTACPILPLTNHLDNLLDTIEKAKIYIRLKPIIIVVLHHYDFAENQQSSKHDLSSLEKIFIKILSDKSINVTSLGKIANEFKPEISLYNIHVYHKLNKVHWRLKQYLPDYYFTQKKFNIFNFLKK